MKKELGIQCLELELQDYNQKQIAEKLNIGQSTVSRQITKITKSREFQMGTITINNFFKVFKKCEQYWQQSNKDYRDLIDQVKEISNDDDVNTTEKGAESFHKSKYDKMMAKIDLISKLKDKQDKNMERILTLATQGEVVLALKAARSILAEHAPTKPFVLEKAVVLSETVKDTELVKEKSNESADN